MRRSAWRRNSLARIVVATAALLATAGAYELVQADPKPGAGSTATPAVATTVAPPPFSPGNASGSSSPAFGGGANSYQPVQPQPRPHMRTRAS